MPVALHAGWKQVQLAVLEKQADRLFIFYNVLSAVAICAVLALQIFTLVVAKEWNCSADPKEQANYHRAIKWTTVGMSLVDFGSGRGCRSCWATRWWRCRGSRSARARS